MSTQRPSDDAIQRALRDRAFRADDDVLAEVLLRDTMQRIQAVEQKQAWLAWPRLSAVGATPVVIMALIAALTVGSIIVVGTWLLPAEEPTDPEVTHRGVRNGAIVSPAGDTVVVVNPDGTRNLLLRVPGRRVDDLSFSPDGRRLAYVQDDAIRVVDVDTGVKEAIGTCENAAVWPCSLAWSPDGSVIAVADGTELRLLTPEGNVRRIVATYQTGIVSDPAWSPGSDQITFVHVADERMELVVSRRDGTGARTIHSAQRHSPFAFGIRQPAWSPAGHRIAFLESAADPGSDLVRTNVYTITPNGEDLYVLFEGGLCTCTRWSPALAWSPDGAYLAMTNRPADFDPRSTQAYLFRIDTDGGNLTLVSISSGSIIAWQPLPGEE